MSEGLEEIKNWDAKSQEKALAKIQELDGDWRPFYCPDTYCDGRPHGDDWNFPHARSDQRPPNLLETWLTWFVLSGRGTGKSLLGSRLTNKMTKKVPNIALIGATGPDLRETMIEGPTGILAHAHPLERPEWNPSRRRLEWPNGAVGRGFTGEEPDRIRGANTGFAWLDEPAHMDRIEEVWKNLLLTMRVKGPVPTHILCTTTPVPTKWVQELEADERSVVTRVSTYANLHNLSDEFVQNVVRPLEGTRWGRQELHGEIVTDMDGTLWKTDMFTYVEESDLPEMDRIVVSVDPAGSVDRRADETGIIVVGISDGTIYVLDDLTGKYSPEKWARLAVEAHDQWEADAIVAEKNYGGDMVKSNLQNAGFFVQVILVNSRRGKKLRAEPVVSLYERGLVKHVKNGRLVHLEDEQVSWIPGKGASPNRIDADVHGITNLVKNSGGAVQVADPNQVLKGKFRSPTGREWRMGR